MMLNTYSYICRQLEILYLILIILIISINSFRFDNLKGFCFYRNYVRNSQALNEKTEINSDEFKAPYLRSLRTIVPKIKHQFFFPGHRSGACAPPQLLIDLIGKEVLQFDLPELDGLDNIHNPEGPLLEALILASKYYGSYRTWFLVNGSTGGIHIAILAAIRLFRKGKVLESNSNGSSSSSRGLIIMPRDAHKSAFSALLLSQCNGILLPCDIDTDFDVSLGIQEGSLESVLKQYGNETAAVLLTRPTYQGICSNSNSLRAIISLCHHYGVMVIVDEAHGSHLRALQLDELQDGVACGADIVVQSSHKTLGSLSQTGMLHISRTAASCWNLDIETVAETVHDCFSMLTTTSPNAILLASLDAARADFSENGTTYLNRSVTAVSKLRQIIRSKRDYIMLLDDSTSIKRKGNLVIDPLRLSLKFLSENSLDVDERMESEDGIFCELNQRTCLTYAIPTRITESDLKYLEESIVKNCLSIDSAACGSPSKESAMETPSLISTELYSHINTILFLASESLRVPLNDNAITYISAETIYVYPPGIPIIVAGEEITRSHLMVLRKLQIELNADISDLEDKSIGIGCTISGNSDSKLDTIKILKLTK